MVRAAGVLIVLGSLMIAVVAAITRNVPIGVTAGFCLGSVFGFYRGTRLVETLVEVNAEMRKALNWYGQRDRAGQN